MTMTFLHSSEIHRNVFVCLSGLWSARVYDLVTGRQTSQSDEIHGEHEAHWIGGGSYTFQVHVGYGWLAVFCSVLLV